jgi:hypothetical protein
MPSVHRNHNVYILGAGFSYNAGLPLMSNFLTVMRESIDWLEQSQRPEVSSINEIFEFRLRASGAAARTKINLDNIEELFSLASASENDLVTKAIPSAIAATLEYAEQRSFIPVTELRFNTGSLTMPSSWQDPPNFKQTTLTTKRVPVYDVFAGLISGRFCRSTMGEMRNTVITFNYDTVLENSLWGQKIPFDYCIPNAATHSSARASTQEQEPLKILKLHGSVNWGTQISEESPTTIYGTYEDLRNADDKPLLVPPTWRKTFGGVLVKVWEEALKAITEATRLIIVGFSIPPTDNHFKYLLGAGLRENVSLRDIVFVNRSEHPERENLFSILREELEGQGIVRFKQMPVVQYFLDKKELELINRHTFRDILDNQFSNQGVYYTRESLGVQ